MNILGVDPGVDGGLVLLNTDTNQVVATLVMPALLYLTSTKRKRRKVDVEALTNFLIKWEDKIDIVFLEKVASRPTDGSVQAFSFGEQYGRIFGTLAALDFVICEIGPRKWQNALGCPLLPGSPKERALLAKQTRFPSLDLRPTPRSKKDHNGLVDALLIAVYGGSIC